MDIVALHLPDLLWAYKEMFVLGPPTIHNKACSCHWLRAFAAQQRCHILQALHLVQDNRTEAIFMTDLLGEKRTLTKTILYVIPFSYDRRIFLFEDHMFSLKLQFGYFY